MMNRNNRMQARMMTQAERTRLALEAEKENPGYLYENRKLTTIVWILTGIRVLYGLFYLFISSLYKIQGAEGWLNLFGSIFFLMWYSLMLRSGKILAVVMLLFRGFGIVTGGASIMAASPWLPLPLIFTLALSIIIEFVEAVFCIYVLFNASAARAVRLNYQLDHSLAVAGVSVSRETLEKMAEYKNPYNGETGAGGEEAKTPDGEDKETPGEEAGENGEFT